jgi:hypothetical protein
MRRESGYDYVSTTTVLEKKRRRTKAYSDVEKITAKKEKCEHLNRSKLKYKVLRKDFMSKIMTLSVWKKRTRFTE